MLLWVRDNSRALALWTHVATLVASGVAIVYWNRRNWFLLDEWAFVAKRSFFGNDLGPAGDPTFGPFDPHNEHWSTIAHFAYRTLMELVGTRSYVPYLLLMVAMHLLAAHLLWRLIRRIVTEPWVATAAVTVFLFLGVGWENLARAFQMTLVGSLAMGFAWLLVMPTTRRFERMDLLGWAFGVAALMFSGVGISMVGVATLFALAVRGWKMALAVVSVPAVTYAAWWMGWGRGALSSGQPVSEGIADAPAFIWSGLTGAIDLTTGLAGLGAVVVVLLVMWTASRAAPFDPRWALPLACAAGALAQLGLTSVRRSYIGIDSAASSRYVYITIALLLPLICLAIDRILPRDRMLWLVAAATAVLLVVQVPTMRTRLVDWSILAEDQRLVFVAAVELEQAGEPILDQEPFPSHTPGIGVRHLVRMVEDGDMLIDDEPSLYHMLTAKTFVQLSFDPVERPAPAPGPAQAAPEVVAFGGVDMTQTADPGCVRLVATSTGPILRLGVDRDVSFTVTAERSGKVSAMYVDPEIPVASRPRDVAVWANEPMQVTSAASGVDLQIGLPTDGFTIVCGLRGFEAPQP